ncbi:S-adenosyl-L-methionine-dependent tRNA 4-demethylwyosine synthase [uncultured archaeon]|nr:S-adenosyl-L-methionine-dependent tRNA 4-demethylwyosine synthase [uncultured archaeon]
MKRNFDDIKSDLENKKYAVVGNSSGVQICNWTKKALKEEGGCWKQKFYGIKSAGCCQFSPSLMWCEHKCVHCWRPIELSLGNKLDKVDDPIEILDKIVLARKKLMMGFKGLDKVNKKKFQQACEPSLYSFSLSGEPTIYPRLDEMLREIRKRKAISFLVTNGQNPEMIRKLDGASSLPTQLTLSTNAPNKELYVKWHNSCNKDAWERFTETIGVVGDLKGKCRRCIRLTLVKPGKDSRFKLTEPNKLAQSQTQGFAKDITNMTEELVGDYTNLILKADPDFVHVKGFTSIGYARNRMGTDKMPWFIEVRKYAKKILTQLNKSDKNWKLLASDKKSCVVVLSKLEKKDMKIRTF